MEKRHSTHVTASGIFIVLICTAPVSLYKQFSIDEFLYAHTAWLVSQGQIPFLDFFEHHTPLQYQFLGFIRWLFLGSDPRHILFYRCVHFGVFLGLLGALAWLGSKRPLGAIFSVLVYLAVGLATNMAIEIRPDSVAAFLFLFSAALLRSTVRSPTRRKDWALVSGILYGLSVWGSLKALIYGFPVVFLSTVQRYLPERFRCLPAPRHFMFGMLIVGLLISLYLVSTGSLFAFWYWCFKWAAHHQAHYPAKYPFFWQFPWFPRLVFDYLWLYPLVGTGLVYAWRERDAFDRLMMSCLFMSLASIAMQSAPYDYNSIIWVSLLSYFAGLGAYQIYQWVAYLWRPSTATALLVALASGLTVSACFERYRTVRTNHNQKQLALLEQIHRLTRPEDCVFDSSASHVTRKHAHFYFFSDALLRNTDAALFSDHLPQAIVDQKCVVALRDARFPLLTPPLRRFLKTHFLPYNGNIFVWGKHIEPSTRNSFNAIQTGNYFLQGGSPDQVKVNGQPLSSSIFRLTQGIHDIESEVSVYLAWLPRDSKPFVPDFRSRGNFSTIIAR